VTAKTKKHKLIHLAKELKLTISHVSDHLEKEGFDFPSSPNTVVTEDAWCRMLELFAPAKFEAYRSELEAKDVAADTAAAADLRREQIADILSADEEEKITSSAVERLRDLKVIETDETETAPVEDEASVPEAVVEEAESIDATLPEPVAEAEVEAVVQEDAPDPVPPVVEVPEPEVVEAEPVAVVPEKSVELEPEPAVKKKPAPKAKAKTEADAPKKSGRKIKKPAPAKVEKTEKAADEKPTKPTKPAKKKVEEVVSEVVLEPVAFNHSKPVKSGQEDQVTTTGRKVVAHEDDGGEKIGLPVFRPGKVLGMHKDPVEPPVKAKKSRKDTKKKDKAKVPVVAAATASDPSQPERDPAKPSSTDDGRGRKRSAKRTKSEELRLQRIEKQREERTSGVAASGKRRKKGKKVKISQEEILAAVKETTRAMEGQKRKKHRKVKGVGELNEETNNLRVTEFITTNELADLLDTPVSELIKKAFMMGTMITINQRLERELIELMCDDYGFDVEFMTEFVEDEEVEEVIDESKLVPRAPVVTVMGHVDHGKTSVLDYIRSTSVVAGEAGGITQHIGAYEVNRNGQTISFLDTPGHHSFTAMRARGAQVTDIVVLVVAADDRVQEQTKEAIDHALAAKVPIIVAVNKVDLPASDPKRIRKELADYNILVEDWGGNYQCVDISAKHGEGMDQLLEEIVLKSEMLELKAIEECEARATVIEAKLDKGRGVIATVLVQRGILKKGNTVAAGTASGRIRLLLDERGNSRDTAPPSTPVQVLGLDSVPQAGDMLIVYASEKDARGVSLKRQQIQREQSQQRISSFTSLADLSQKIAKGAVRDLAVIIKGDVDGSIGAIADELMQMQTAEVRVNVIARSVGNITESDILLAKASGAIIIGFHVSPTPKARELAQRERVDVRLYKVIYEVVEEIHAALEGMLVPDTEEEICGTSEVRQVFRIGKKAIAGCMVLSGKMERKLKARVVRDSEEVFNGDMSSLKRFKDDVKEVAQGFECGIQLQGYNDLQEGDLIHVYSVKEITRRLDLAKDSV
jgi:translation initiation factor IF-2